MDVTQRAGSRGLRHLSIGTVKNGGRPRFRSKLAPKATQVRRAVPNGECSNVFNDGPVDTSTPASRFSRQSRWGSSGERGSDH
jgi:hypothetical protein